MFTRCLINEVVAAVICGVSLVIFATSTAGAQADPPFRYAGIACEPSQETARRSICVQSHGKVYHRDGANGIITLFAPVLNTTTKESVNWNTLVIHYLDPDDLGSQYTVSGSLRRLDPQGEVSVLTEATSDKIRNLSSSHVNWATGTFTQPIDFNKGTYYVQIAISRGPTEKRAEFFDFKLAHE